MIFGQAADGCALFTWLKRIFLIKLDGTGSGMN